MAKMTRAEYAAMYGPTVGEGVYLGDTDLVAVVEKDYAVYGDEYLHGGGKTLRDGAGMAAGITSRQGALDLLLCNVVVIDAVVGIVKGDIAKYTINAAKTFGIADHVGSLEDGKLADIVIWRPAFFGIKPELMVKGGFIAWGMMGDSAVSLMTCEPLLMRPQWGHLVVRRQHCQPVLFIRWHLKMIFNPALI